MVAVARDRQPAEATRLSRPTRYLTRMTLFVVVVIVVALVLGQGLLRAFDANPALNGVILGMTILGIAYAYRSVLTLKPEIAWLESVQSHRPQTASPAPEPRLLGALARMIGERQGRLTMSAMAMRSVLDGVGARLGESREISRYLIGVLIFLGLLGTFWGLLQTISAVGQVIGGLSIEEGDLALVFSDLKEGLEAPLAGMGTAFSSSLFGLAGSLVLGFLELQASQAQNRFYNELEDWLSGTARLTGGGAVPGDGEPALPAYLQGLVGQTAENLDSVQRLLAANEQSRRESVGAMHLLAEKLATLNDHMRTQQTVMVRVAESQHELRPLLARLSEIAGADGFGIDEGSRQHIRNIETLLRQISDDLEQNRNQTIGEVRSEIKTLSRTIAALAEGAEDE